MKTPEKLGKVIQDMTEKLCGEGEFSEDVIRIRLTAPESPDLTIIDLPGIVRTTTNGQETKVIDSVNSLIERYLKKKRTIILAVIPCTQDLATCEILEKAQKVDPEGQRTIGVLTKPDLIPKGTEHNWESVLANVTKPLLHGYYCVCNRSQDDLNNKLSPEKARDNESSYFANHFAEFSSNTGVVNLTKKLTELLIVHIQKCLPTMHSELQDLLDKTNIKIKELGEKPPIRHMRVEGS